MQRYFSKSLVGLLMVITGTHLASGHSLYFGRSPDVEDEIPELRLVEESNIDHANELGDTPSVDNTLNSKKATFRHSNAPTVQLEGIRHEADNKQGYAMKFRGIQYGNGKPEEGGESQEFENVKHGVEIEEGDTYELVCKVSAGPEAQVYWIRGDNPEQQIKIEERSKSRVSANLENMDKNRLTLVELKHVIECATQKDAGRIHCVAIAGNEISVGSTTIAVKESSKRFRPAYKLCKPKPAPRIMYHTATMMSVIGTTVVLTCEPTGSPTPVVNWYINDENVLNLKSSRYQISGNDLIIKDIEWNDMGVFVCKAVSDFGTAYADTFLYPLARE